VGKSLRNSSLGRQERDLRVILRLITGTENVRLVVGWISTGSCPVVQFRSGGVGLSEYATAELVSSFRSLLQSWNTPAGGSILTVINV